ncbi:hypothetical protein AAG570_010678 [Ranatra chinensis]|uniref:Uncharacterized protein n=1 Tax=Ranatra chinensis TaxID=642074 RepID=A0ABD0YNQ9_9HEMI
MKNHIKNEATDDLPACPKETSEIWELKGKTGKPLRLFTNSGNPVTDWSGRPLRNIRGEMLFTFISESNRWVDPIGNLLRDAYGNKPGEFNFDPERVPKKEILMEPISDDSGKPMLIYDMKGNPLTNICGQPLADSQGNCLLLFDSRGDPISDVVGRTIMNERGEILTDPRKQAILTPRGEPAYLFDIWGKPLTDQNGYPLQDLRGEPIVMKDRLNSPWMTNYGSDLYDADGTRRSDARFDMSKKPRTKTDSALNKVENGSDKSIFIFDKFGRPLTDWNANPLINRSGKSVLSEELEKMNEVYKIPKEIYQASKFCVLRNNDGLGARLYNAEGRPLTNHLGEVLTNARGSLLLKFDSEGYPIGDMNGEKCFDDLGNAIGSRRFYPFGPNGHYNLKTLNLKGKDLGVLFDATGLPVTDAHGNPLFNSKGKSMVKFSENNIPINGIDGGILFEISGLPLPQSLDKPLYCPRGCPVRLFDSDGHPLTDKFGYILKCVKGEYLLKVDQINRIVSDRKNGPVFDAKRVPKYLHLEFDCRRVPENETESQRKRCRSPKVLYNFKGFPLTDSSGKLLVDVTGKPLIEFECTKNPEISNLVFDLEGSTYVRRVEVGCALNHLLFTGDGIPLTDTAGHILKSRTGSLLVELDSNGLPIKDALSRPLYDENGKLLTNQSPVRSKIAAEGQFISINLNCNLYDHKDWPLTDEQGFLLYKSTGSPLIIVDNNGKPLSDYMGDPVYDENGVPVTAKAGCWVDQHGRGLRLYDPDGLPLTDVEGRELYDLSGNSCIRADSIGRPAMDREFRPIRDALGSHITDPKFDASVSPQGPHRCIEVLDDRSRATRIFDKTGRPLTDCKGRCMFSSDGSPLIRISDSGRLADREGDTVYDADKMPLGCGPGKPIKYPCGKPMRLYDSCAWPLTDKEGFPLLTAGGRSMLLVDRLGRPASDLNGGDLYDGEGRKSGEDGFAPLISPWGDGFTKLCLFGLPEKIYDEKARPLTDSDGLLLMNAFGQELVSLGCRRLFNEIGEEVYRFKNSRRATKKGRK